MLTKKLIKVAITCFAFASCAVAFASGNIFSTVLEDRSAATRQFPEPTIEKPTVQKQGVIDKIAAVVNGDVITENELRTKMVLIESDLRNSGATVPSESALRKKVLREMIDTTLQLQVAERAGVKVSNDEVNKAVTSIAKRNNLSVFELRSKMQDEGLDFGAFRKQIREQMIVGRVARKSFGHKISVSEKEVAAAIKAHKGSSKLSEKYARELVYRKKFTKQMRKWMKELRDSAYISRK